MGKDTGQDSELDTWCVQLLWLPHHEILAKGQAQYAIQVQARSIGAAILRL